MGTILLCVSGQWIQARLPEGPQEYDWERRQGKGTGLGLIGNIWDKGNVAPQKGQGT